VRRLCALHGVTRAGFYAWRARGESARRTQDRTLTRQIQAIFSSSGGSYGSPRIHRALGAAKIRVSRRRVERLMRAAGLRGRVARVYRAHPGVHRFFSQHPNRVWRRCATRRDRIWVADLTHVAVAGQWRYLAVVLDQYSRRVLSWSLSRTRTTSLTRRALDRAVQRRQPARGLIFHSDRGSEYAGAPFRDRLNALGIRQSMTREGAPSENAHVESFFHPLKADVVHGVRFTTDPELRRAVRQYVQYYNHHRLHSALSYRSPVDYERRAA
jgi:putative transposase